MALIISQEKHLLTLKGKNDTISAKRPKVMHWAKSMACEEALGKPELRDSLHNHWLVPDSNFPEKKTDKLLDGSEEVKTT